MKTKKSNVGKSIADTNRREKGLLTEWHSSAAALGGPEGAQERIAGRPGRKA